jgi:hypothetical protein
MSTPRTKTGLKWPTLVLTCLGIAIAMAGLAAAAPTPAVPDAVSKAFKEKFPQAKVTQIEPEVDEEVTVYNYEFKDGSAEKETTIAEDGTILEIGYVIPAKELPDAAMKAIKKMAPGATLERIVRVEATHDADNGAVTKLPQTFIDYEVQLKKPDTDGWMVVTPDGKVLTLHWD